MEGYLALKKMVHVANIGLQTFKPLTFLLVLMLCGFVSASRFMNREQCEFVLKSE
jgi:hypothetical protein